MWFICFLAVICQSLSDFSPHHFSSSYTVIGLQSPGLCMLCRSVLVPCQLFLPIYSNSSYHILLLWLMCLSHHCFWAIEHILKCIWFSSSSLFPNPRSILLLVLCLFCWLWLCLCCRIIAQVAVRNMEMFFLLFSDLPSSLATSAPTCSPFWALSAVLPSQPLCWTQRWNDRSVWKCLTTLQYYLLMQDITVNPGSPLLFTTTLFSFWGN